MTSGSFHEWEDGTAPLPRLDSTSAVDVDHAEAKRPADLIDERAPHLSGELPKLEVEADGEGAGEAAEAEAPSPDALPGAAHASAPKPVSKFRRGAWIVTKVALFIAIGLAIWGFIGRVLNPYQNNSNMTDMMQAFHEEPENTVDTLFLGASVAADGFIPTQLFEEYGICSYNLATAGQPLFVSKLLAFDAYAHHPETLENIVIDANVITYEPPDEVYRVATDNIPFSTKLAPVLAWENPAEEDRLVYLSDVYGYHTRWDDLTEEDIAKLTYPTHNYLRGYEPSLRRLITDSDASLLDVAPEAPDMSVAPKELAENQVAEFQELVDWAKERGITVTLVKTPVIYAWTDDNHVALQNLCDENGITFIDMNYAPFFRETGYNVAIHTRDAHHSNDEGAAILTSYIGRYLTENGLAEDRRGDERYAFMDEQIAKMREATTDLTALRSSITPADYLAKAMADPRYTLAVALDNEGSMKLTDEQRQALAALGLETLAATAPGDCYWGIIENGAVVAEDTGEGAGERVYTNRGEFEYILPFDEDLFRILPSSDPYAQQALAHLEDPANNPLPDWNRVEPGLTVQVFDRELDSVVDYAVFYERTGLERYCYPQQMLDAALLAGQDTGELPWYVWRLGEYENVLAEYGLWQPVQPLGSETPEDGGAEEGLPSDEVVDDSVW